MSTDNKIQRLTPGASDESMNRVKWERFIPAGDFDAGDALIFDVEQTGSDKVLFVKQAPETGSGQNLFAGIALESSAVTGSTEGRRSVRVAISGYVPFAHVNAGAVAGETLQVGQGVAGQLSGSLNWPGADGLVVAAALSDEVSGSAEVLLRPHFL